MVLPAPARPGQRRREGRNGALPQDQHHRCSQHSGTTRGKPGARRLGEWYCFPGYLFGRSSQRVSISLVIVLGRMMPVILGEKSR